MDEEKLNPDSGEFAGYGAASPEDGERDSKGPEENPQTPGETPAPEDAKPEKEPAKETEKEPEKEPAPTDPLDLPIEDFAKVDLGLGDAPVDKSVMAAFGEECVKLKLSPRQAAALAQFQLAAVNKAREELTSETFRTLRKEWGSDAGNNQQKIIALVSRIDQTLGNAEFSEALNQSGIACYAPFARGFLALAQMLGEDSLGPLPKPGADPQKETALEGLQAAFAQAKGR